MMEVRSAVLSADRRRRSMNSIGARPVATAALLAASGVVTKTPAATWTAGVLPRVPRNSEEPCWERATSRD